ncbi:MAG: hypothetical protein ACXAC7_11960 [Candidatus Hodarchaeales archaeon]|jgi:hypothetical protein
MPGKTQSGLVYFISPRNIDTARKYKIAFTSASIGLVFYLIIIQFYLIVSGISFDLLSELAQFPDPEISVYLTLLSILMAPVLIILNESFIRYDLLFLILVPWFISGIITGVKFGSKTEGGLIIGTLLPSLIGLIGFGSIAISLMALILISEGTYSLVSGILGFFILIGLLFIILLILSLFFIYVPLSFGYIIGQRFNTRIYPQVLHARPSISDQKEFPQYSRPFPHYRHLP